MKNEKAVEKLSKQTADFSNREILKIVKRALFYALLRDINLPIITSNDFQSAVNQLKKDKKKLQKIDFDGKEVFNYCVQTIGAAANLVSIINAVLSLKNAASSLGLAAKGLKYQSQGISLQEKGLEKQDEGLSVQKEGIQLQAKGISLQEKSMVLQEKGIALQEKGLQSQDMGIILQEKGLQVQEKGMSLQTQSVDMQKKGLDLQEEKFRYTKEWAYLSKMDIDAPSSSSCYCRARSEGVTGAAGYTWGALKYLWNKI